MAAMVPPSAAALMQHQRMGNVDWRMAAGLAAGDLLPSPYSAPADAIADAWLLLPFILSSQCIHMYAPTAMRII
jgi:hypothetical protein